MNKKLFGALIRIMLIISLALVGCEKARANPETDFRRQANDLGGVTIPSSVTFIGYAAFPYDQLSSITIGANVSISQDSLHGTLFFGPTDSGIYEIIPYDNSFETTYENSGKKAGTYVLRNGSWAKQ